MTQHKPVAWRRVIGNVTKHYEYNEVGVGGPLYDLETVRQLKAEIAKLTTQFVRVADENNRLKDKIEMLTKGKVEYGYDTTKTS